MTDQLNEDQLNAAKEVMAELEAGAKAAQVPSEAQARFDGLIDRLKSCG